MLIALVSATLLMSGTLIAAPPGAAIKAKSRTISDLVTLAASVGEDKTLGPPLSSNLGFPGMISGKILSYDETVSADHKGHDLIVVFEKGKPSELIWSVTALVNENTVDGLTFRSTLKGKLKAAIRAKGVMGHVVQDKVNLKDAAAPFTALKNFFQNATEDGAGG